MQPWTSPNGRWALCYNGEIFNHDEAAGTGSPEQGHPQRSESDTEVVLEALLAWGEDAMLQFRGEFAFALVDRETGTVLLARDPAGVKPLYWARTDGRLHIASEVKALTSLGAPIHEVPPGYIGRGSAARRSACCGPTSICCASAKASPMFTDVEQAKRRCARRSRIRCGCASTPTCRSAVILSGGLDSSLTLLHARRMHPNVHAFTVGTKGSEDVAYASRLATRSRRAARGDHACARVTSRCATCARRSTARRPPSTATSSTPSSR